MNTKEDIFKDAYQKYMSGHRFCGIPDKWIMGAMQEYSDQQLEEYKKKLKEAVTGNRFFISSDAYSGMIDLIDTI